MPISRFFFRPFICKVHDQGGLLNILLNLVPGFLGGRVPHAITYRGDLSAVNLKIHV